MLHTVSVVGGNVLGCVEWFVCIIISTGEHCSCAPHCLRGRRERLGMCGVVCLYHNINR